MLDELLSDALRMAEDSCQDPNADALQILNLLAGVQPEHLKENESLLPVCHRVAQLPKYQVIFHDETISNYVVNRIFKSQKQKLIPVYMDACGLSKKEAEMLTLFVITGTYNDIVNIPLHFFFTKSFKLLALMYHSIVFV